MNGFAQGLNQTYNQNGNNGQMTAYQAARLKQQQATSDAQVNASNASTNLNEAKLTGQEYKNQQLKADQEFNQGVVKAASAGGFAAAIDFAQKSGRYEWVADRLKEQSELNNSIATGAKLKADATDAEIKAYNDKQKALGGLAGSFYTDIKAGQNPVDTYEKYKPVIKQVWPDAPDKFDDKADSMLKIALSQSLQQNTNFSRMTQVGKLLHERAQAIKAGDTEGTAYYDGQLKKISMFVNQQTGEVYNLVGNAPDTHQGSVDTKAAAVGLAAGSQIPPVEGAVFHNQPMNNVMDNEYKQYDQNNGIQPQERTIRNLKSSPGYNNVIMPDGTNKQVSIEGGAADKPKIGPQPSTLTSALQRGQKSVNSLFDTLLDSKGNVKPEATRIINEGAIVNASLDQNFLIRGGVKALTSGNAQLFQTYASTAIEGIMRGFTGATINESERPRLENELIPQPGDKPDTIKAKLMITHEILTGSLNIMSHGLKGGLAKGGKEEGATVDWNLLNKVKEYATHGGNVLDITKGNGADPEKARLNQLKELSYDPKMVQMIMNGQTNGQGRDYTEQEAKTIIDGMPKKQQGGQ